MTLEEAIKHCEEVAKRQEYLSKNYREFVEEKWNIEKRAECAECAADHRQLEEWLKELIAYRKLRICGNCRHYVCGTTHFGECHVTSDTKPCVVSINQTACDTFFDYKDIQPICSGHWIEHNDCIECSVCGFEVKDPYCEKRDMTCTETSYDHCPKCGSDMHELELNLELKVGHKNENST